MTLRHASKEEFLQSPDGSCVVERGFALFFAQGVAGCVMSGGVDGEQVAQILSLVPAILRAPGSGPILGVIDAVDLTDAAPVAFSHYRAFVDAFAEELGARVHRVAIARPRTLLLGALAEGFFRIVSVPHEVEVFADVWAGSSWLRAQHASSLVTRARELREEYSVALRLRGLFRERLRFVGIDDGAAALGVSPRSLQRMLKTEGTTFRRELDRARVEAAQRAMRAGEASLTRIAYDVGCASPAHLTTLFRRVAGTSPSAWRRCERGSARELV